MEPAFWHQKWHKQEIGFHLSQIHPGLSHHYDRLQDKGHVLVPLCGKSLDLAFLHEQGHQVSGVELSATAVAAFFTEQGWTPQRRPWAGGDCWEHGRLRLFQGDLFALQPEQLVGVDAVYDRAALIALPPSMRGDYARHLIELSDGAPQLLITLDYDTGKMAGPPFAVCSDEVHDLYGETYRIDVLHRRELIELEPRFQERGLDSLTETTYWLSPR